MFTSGETIFTIFDIFFIIIFLLSIIQIILISILKKQVSKYEYIEFFSIKEKDIPISALKYIDFTQNESKPGYNPNTPNLGSAGEFIFDCYIGYCIEEKIEKKYVYCSNDDEECENNYVKSKYYANITENLCSYECFESKGEKCHKCPSKYISSEGKCEISTNDKYSPEKYCLSHNVIYFWKGKKFEAFNYGYSYLKNAILKNEECPSKTRNCGIIDDNGNKLCMPENLECPINIISEEKFNNSKYSFTVGSKTFYYGYDENAKNKKIIAGLYVDTDIYPNKNEKEYIILDTYTISGLLEENKKLYKGVNLGFDPYTKKDIDQKGKSYLKIKYNENVDLISLRGEKKNDVKNNDYYNILIKEAFLNFEPFAIMGFCGYIWLIIVFQFNMLNECCYKTNDKEKISKNQHKFKCCFIPSLVLFFILTIILTIKSFTNFGKLNEIGKRIDISYLKKINLIFIIFSFLCYGVIALFIFILCQKINRKDLSDNQNIKNTSDTSEININRKI